MLVDMAWLSHGSWFRVAKPHQGYVVVNAVLLPNCPRTFSAMASRCESKILQYRINGSLNSPPQTTRSSGGPLPNPVTPTNVLVCGPTIPTATVALRY
jgi:hypothetical protein